LILSLNALFGWQIHQMDVKNLVEGVGGTIKT